MTGITNGNFETGDLTGWTIWRNPETSDAVVNISSAQHHTGSYSCRLYCNDTTGDTSSYIYQPDVTPSTDVIEVWVYVTISTEYANLTVNFQKDTPPWEEVSTIIDTTTSGWQVVYLDISSLTEVTTGTIRIFASAGASGEEEAFVDDVKFSSASPPDASFTVDDATVGTNVDIHFTDTSTNDPTSWSWDFDDGSSPSTEQNPTHAYDSAGTYTPVLTATNADGSDQYSLPSPITVYNLPVSSFTSSIDGSDPLTIHFTDTSTNSPSSWGWNFGDGSTSTDQNPDHTYSSPGYYHVTLTATNTGGSGSAGSGYVTASLNPAVAQVTGDSDPLNFISAIVSKQITDACWKAEVNIPTEYTPPTSDDLPVITITVPDHTNTNQTIFYGIVTNIKYKQTPTGLTTTLICYDYAYYLTCQYIPIKTTMYSSSGSVYTPSQVVKRFLGTDTTATDWDHITGIHPYNIDTVTGWGSSTCPSKAFDWTYKTRKWSALQDITDYTDHILYVHWKYNDPLTNAWCPVCYFVDATDIDTGAPLDLPSMVTCTASTDPYLVNEITTVNQDEFRYNSVKIYGEDSDGLSLVGSSTAEGVGDTIKPIEYIEENNDYKTQTLVDSVADSYLTYLNIPGDVYTATFAKRADLRLLQKIQFLGYDQVPEEEMRISGITYTITPGDVRVTCTVTTDRKFNSARKLKKVILPSVFTALSGALQKQLNEDKKAILVTIITASSGSYIIEDNAGNIFPATGPS